MTRLGLVVLVMLLLGNNGLPRRVWQPAAYAAVPSPTAKARIHAFGSGLIVRWNVGAPAEYRAVVSFCGDYGRTPAGERVYYCGWRIHDPHSRWRCRAAALTASYLEIPGTAFWVKCTGVLKPPPHLPPPA